MFNKDLEEMGFPGGSEGRASACNAGDLGPIPRSGRSLGEGNSNPHQYCHLENSMDRGALLATVHGVSKSRTQLSNFTSLLYSGSLWFLFIVEVPHCGWGWTGGLLRCPG